MACPTVEFADRKLIVLIDTRLEPSIRPLRGRDLPLHSLPGSQQLKQAALQNPDAVAFGYTRGLWFPAA
jgi:hypothetical protein